MRKISRTQNAYKYYFESADGGTTTRMYGGIQAGSSGDSGNGFQLKFIITGTYVPRQPRLCGFSSTHRRHPQQRLLHRQKSDSAPNSSTDNRTKNSLTSKEIRNATPAVATTHSCQPSHPFVFFETASHTFPHEMTHVDQRGVEAGLLFLDNTADDSATHGTEDIYQIADGYL